jgi:hypothetical protein
LLHLFVFPCFGTMHAYLFMYGFLGVSKKILLKKVVELFIMR